MNKNRKLTYTLIAAFILSLGLYDYFFKPNVQQVKTVQTQSLERKKTQNDQLAFTQAKNTRAPTAEVQIEERTVDTHNGTITLTNEYGFLKNWTLSNYGKVKGGEEKVDLNFISHTDHELGLVFDSQEFLYLKDVKGIIKEESDISFSWNYEDEKIKLKKIITLIPGTSKLSLTISGAFKGDKPNYVFLSVKGKNVESDPEERFRSFVYFTEKKYNYHLLSELSSGAFDQSRTKDLLSISTPVKWIGLASRYFLFSIHAEDASSTTALLQPLGKMDGRISYISPLSSKEFTNSYSLFFGPKELGLLRSVDPTMDTAVDLGWFSFIGYFLLRAMNWLYLYVHNYGWAIIILTVLLKILTYPLTYKSMKSMKEMSKLQPEIAKVREKYKDNKEKLNQEMMALMKTKGYNPLAGCLPILIQMPVFIALYNVLLSSVELYQAPFGLWILDLSEKDPYFVTPIALSALMWLQQTISPSTATDPMQKKMMQFMPVVFGMFMLYLPSGLTLYMLANVIAGIVQQVILNKKLDLKNVSNQAIPAAK